MAAKLGFIFLGLLADHFVEDYDHSPYLLEPLSRPINADATSSESATRVFQEDYPSRAALAFFKWDSMFFYKIAENGYLYEKNHAFFPLYPYVLGVCQRAIQ